MLHGWGTVSNVTPHPHKSGEAVRPVQPEVQQNTAAASIADALSTHQVLRQSGAQRSLDFRGVRGSGWNPKEPACHDPRPQPMQCRQHRLLDLAAQTAPESCASHMKHIQTTLDLITHLALPE